MLTLGMSPTFVSPKFLRKFLVVTSIFLLVFFRLTWNLHNKKGQDPKKYGPQVKHVTYQDMAKFKYQVLVDGTVAPYRTSNLMQLDTVILKQASSEFNLTVVSFLGPKIGPKIWVYYLNSPGTEL